MLYDRKSSKHDLILLGHMCNLRVNANNFIDFFQFLATHNINSSIVSTHLGNHYYVSLYLPTTKYAEEVYEILLTWNP